MSQGTAAGRCLAAHSTARVGGVVRGARAKRERAQSTEHRTQCDARSTKKHVDVRCRPREISAAAVELKTKKNHYSKIILILKIGPDGRMLHCCLAQDAKSTHVEMSNNTRRKKKAWKKDERRAAAPATTATTKEKFTNRKKHTRGSNQRPF